MAKPSVDSVPFIGPVELTCIICFEIVAPDSSVIVPSCSHIWCDRCIFDRFSDAIKSESSYPVICCNYFTPIEPSPAIETIIGRYMKSLFLAKKTEYESTDRTYCHIPKCSSFIPPSTIKEKLAVCPKCQTTTCAQCKRQWHGDDTAGCKDSDDDMFKAWCAEANLKKCPKCGQAVERIAGCNQIRCTCGQKFCYTCAKPLSPWSCSRPIELAGGAGSNDQAIEGASRSPARQGFRHREGPVREQRDLERAGRRDAAPVAAAVATRRPPSSLSPIPQLPTFRRLFRSGRQTLTDPKSESHAG